MMQMSALTRSQPAPFQPAGVSAIRSVQPQHCQRLIAARGMGGSPQQMAEMMQKMMQNPEVRTHNASGLADEQQDAINWDHHAYPHDVHAFCLMDLHLHLQMAGQLKAMQEAMKNPEIQKAYMQQMQQMQSVMQSQQLKDRMESLKNDPEFAHVFADIQKNGEPAFLAALWQMGLQHVIAAF